MCMTMTSCHNYHCFQESLNQNFRLHYFGKHIAHLYEFVCVCVCCVFVGMCVCFCPSSILHTLFSSARHLPWMNEAYWARRVPFLAEAIPFPRPATDRMTDVSNWNLQSSVQPNTKPNKHDINTMRWDIWKLLCKKSLCLCDGKSHSFQCLLCKYTTSIAIEYRSYIVFTFTRAYVLAT